MRHASGDLRATNGWSSSCSTLTSVEAGQRRRRRDDEDARLHEQRLDAQPVLNEDGRAQERDVDGAVGQSYVGIGEIVGAHLDLDLGVQVVEGVEDLGCQLRCGVGLEADDELRCRSAAAGVWVMPGDSFGIAEQPSAAVEQHLPGWGELDVPAVRTNSGAFRECSSLRIWMLSDGCAMCRRAAARPKCSSSATATKYVSSRRSSEGSTGQR